MSRGGSSSNNVGGFSAPSIPCPNEKCTKTRTLNTILEVVIPFGVIACVAGVWWAYSRFAHARRERRFYRNNPQFVITEPAEEIKHSRSSKGVWAWMKSMKAKKAKKDVEAVEAVSGGDRASLMSSIGKTDLDSLSVEKREEEKKVP